MVYNYRDDVFRHYERHTAVFPHNLQWFGVWYIQDPVNCLLSICVLPSLHKQGSSERDTCTSWHYSCGTADNAVSEIENIHHLSVSERIIDTHKRLTFNEQAYVCI